MRYIVSTCSGPVLTTRAALTVPGAADVVDLLTGAGLLILGGLLYWAAAATRRHRHRE